MAARILFEQELDALNQELNLMSEMAERAIEYTFEALERNDSNLAREIIKGDNDVDDMERKIESRCLSLMLRQQPVAGDLRYISMALKVVTDLERIGDHAADIAELTLHLNRKKPCAAIKHLPAMVEQVKLMVRDAIQAFISRDAQEAEKIEARDDMIDALFDKVKEEMVELLKNDSGQSDSAVDLLMIAKYLERIGDHAVNVCEWTEFSDKGMVKNTLLL